ncbi:MAG: hypothetical protein IKS18_04515 [Lachnospiraceae bacterium]|nr:hypothetical protein [Lachnospiraceae bacterium]
MEKTKSKAGKSGISLFEKARIVNRSVENTEKAWKLVKRVVIPAAVVGFAVLAYAVFDVDVSRQARK